MSAGLFDLGLGADDEAALREARHRPLVVDRDAALRLIAEASARVAAAVSRRPVFQGAPFTLPGHEEDAPAPRTVAPRGESSLPTPPRDAGPPKK